MSTASALACPRQPGVHDQGGDEVGISQLTPLQPQGMTGVDMGGVTNHSLPHLYHHIHQ